jgi:hypothetical protein
MRYEKQKKASLETNGNSPQSFGLARVALESLDTHSIGAWHVPGTNGTVEFHKSFYSNELSCRSSRFLSSFLGFIIFLYWSRRSFTTRGSNRPGRLPTILDQSP